MSNTSSDKQSGGINISGGSIQAGGDVVGGDKITISDVGAGAVVAAGRGAQATMGGAGAMMDWDAWAKAMMAKIDAKPDVPAPVKQDAKDKVNKIAEEARKGDKADVSTLEYFINTLAVMGPDIFEVALATLQNPLAGIGLALKKISDKAKLERASKAA